MARLHQIFSKALCHHLLLLVLFLVSCSVSASTVKYLPGFKGALPFHLETGYVGVSDSEDVQLFYYFVKSERNPEKDPLLLWLTGGPGCSSWSGLAYQIGPLRYKIERYNGSLPILLLNQYSWTKVSNIIFVDSPVGTGFSYAKTSEASQTGDLKQVNDLYQFLKKWLINHPEFISNPVYIGGDSYSGITVPILVQQISNGINEAIIIPPINLQGYILGNPFTDFSSDCNYRVKFAHGMALISDEQYKSLERNCRGKYYNEINPSNTKCLKEFQVFEETISGIQLANILEPLCPFASPKPLDILSERRSLGQSSQVFLPFESPLPTLVCREYAYSLFPYWANDPLVRKALHIRKGSIGEWNRCNFSIPFAQDTSSSYQYHVNLSTKGYRSLIFSGDHDMDVPFLSTQAWIRSLNYSIVEHWRPWIVQGQVAGYTKSYSNRMTFATVKGGGHTAAQDKPRECLAMFKRWIDYESL